MTTELWVTPLVMLPGVALLVLSTSVRYGQIHEEFHRFESKGALPVDAPGHLLQRATLFRNALVSLYSAVCCFALGSLSGGLAALVQSELHTPVLVLTAIGVAAVAYAAAQLIRESLQSLEVIRAHIERK